MDRETVQAVRVPVVEGLLVGDAVQTLVDVGLRSALQPSDPLPGPAATAVATFPPAGELAIVESTVALFWSEQVTEEPPPEPAVPGGLVGSRESDAINIVTQAGYNPLVVKQYDIHVPADEVGSTSPAEGTPLSPGSTVTLYVSLGDGGPVRKPPPPPRFVFE